MVRTTRACFRSAFLFASAVAVAAVFGDRRIDADDSAKASSKIDDSWNAVFDRRDGWTARIVPEPSVSATDECSG